MRRLLLLPLLLLTLRAVPAQTPNQPAAEPPNQPGSFRVAGTVVGELDNQPLQHATVQLLNEGDRKPFQSTTSDELGRFAFTGVPAGNFVLQGSAPGYLPTSYDDHGGFNTGIVTGTGAGTESLVLKLHPQGMLNGTILDQSADPVERAMVHFFRQSRNDGDSRLVPAGNTQTDDLGHFEFPRLAPGAYMLAVTAAPWYAVHPIPALQQQPRALFGVADSIDPSLDVAYPTTYYPGTTDESEATPILIRGGGPVEIGLRLSPQPALSVTFPLAQPKQGQPINLPQLINTIFGQIESVSSTQIQQGNNQITIAGLAPGNYLLASPGQADRANGATPLHLTGNTNASVPAAPAVAHVRVLLKSADGSPLPSGLLVTLTRQHTQDVAARASSQKAEARFDVAPGDYFFALCNNGRRCFVRQVLAGDRPLASNDIHIASAGDLTFTVVLEIGAHTIKGVAEKDGKPTPGAFVLLFPSGERGDIRTFIPQQSDLDGSFEIDKLVPGDYTLLSIDGGWDLDWQKDAVLSRYLASAVTIKVAASPATQTLPTPIPVQPK